MNKNRWRAAYAGSFVAVAALGTFYIAQKPGYPPIFPATHTAACDAAISDGYCEHGKKCNVTVTVSACGTGVRPDVQPESLAICEKNARITWTLVGTGQLSGVKFADNGVAFKKQDEFNDKDVKKKSYQWTDKHLNLGYFEYGLHILQQDASPCIDFDPRVSNE